MYLMVFIGFTNQLNELNLLKAFKDIHINTFVHKLCFFLGANLKFGGVELFHTTILCLLVR